MIPLGLVAKFYEPVQIIGGPRTRAIVHRPSDTDDPGPEFAQPKTTLRVKPNSLIKTGQAIQVQGGDVYLVAEHSRTGDYATHRLFKADRQVVWTRAQTKVHPVTNLPISDTPSQMGTIWVLWERSRREFMDLTLRIPQDSFLVATVAPVMDGDFLDGQRVKRVSNAMGIKVVELGS